MTRKFAKEEMFCYTSDCWYPNIDGDKVKVSMHLNVPYTQDKPHSVCVWGDDDCGMELWSKDKHLIRQTYRKICNLNDVTKIKLDQLGLSNA